MPNGLETQPLGVDPSVDPVILAVMFVAFLIGAVGPFALCVIGSIREEQAMRRHAALIRGDRSESPASPPAVANAGSRSTVPASVALQPASVPAPSAAANDAVGPVRAVGG